jgi:hypothetical protein
LSDQCSVSQPAISRGEQTNLHAIRWVFEEHGIEFLGRDGVRLLSGSSEN